LLNYTKKLSSKMFQNYIKIAWKNIIRHKVYSFINIAGLTVGIAACLLIFVVVEYELSYDNFHDKASHIYRIVTQNTYSDGAVYEEGLTAPATEALRVDLLQVEKVTEVFSTIGSQFNTLDRNGNTDKKFIEEKGAFFIDPQFFSVFSTKWLVGNASVLAEPNMVVLNKSQAIKYFGEWKNAMGQTLKMDNLYSLKVAGILEDQPANTDFPLNILVSFISLKAHGNDYGYQPNEWGANTSSHQVFLLLPAGLNPNNINTQLIGFVKKHYHLDGLNMKKTLFLQPLKDMHFDTRFGNFGEHLTSKTTIWTLSLIGLFILIMASINFVNLSTAQATQRSKEVGIRKVLGSSRKQLIFQVFGETGIIVFFSLMMAALLAKLALPYLNNVANIAESTHLMTTSSILFLLIAGIAVTFLSGFYPAMVLSGFRPALALKSRISLEKVKGISLRRILVVTQFTISQVLIIGTIVAVSQMNFIRNADLGFNKESILVIPNNTDSISLQHMDALKLELQKLPGVQSVTMMFDAPSTGNNWESNFNYDHSDKDPGFNVSIKQADADYFKTFGLQFVAGNTYQQSDTLKEMVVNETLLRKLLVKNPQDAIGKTIKLGNRWIPITGVVKDFKTSSLREQTRPLVIVTRKKYYSRIGIKIHSANFSQTVAAIQTLWEKTYPDYVYTPEFMDESIAKFYKQESQMELLYKIFAALAILISCLGLYGLVSFMAQQKTKEIGVRKVLGATVSSIVYLFSKEFTLLILIAFAIALPVAYFLMNAWLVNFAYRIDLGVGIFLIAILASMLLAWMTVGYKAIKAALANPVKSLRSE